MVWITLPRHLRSIKRDILPFRKRKRSIKRDILPFRKSRRLMEREKIFPFRKSRRLLERDILPTRYQTNWIVSRPLPRLLSLKLLEDLLLFNDNFCFVLFTYSEFFLCENFFFKIFSYFKNSAYFVFARNLQVSPLDLLYMIPEDIKFRQNFMERNLNFFYTFPIGLLCFSSENEFLLFFDFFKYEMDIFFFFFKLKSCYFLLQESCDFISLKYDYCLFFSDIAFFLEQFVVSYFDIFNIITLDNVNFFNNFLYLS